MITIIIFIFIAFFIWGRIVSSKVKQNPTITTKTPQKNPKERFREYVMKLMHNTIIENRKDVRNLNNISIPPNLD